MTRTKKIPLLVCAFLILSASCTAATLNNSPTGVNASINLKCCVTGKVYDKDGKPAVRAVVTLEDEDGKQAVVRSDNKGRFRLEGIVPGAVYHIEVKHPDGVYRASVQSFLAGDHIEIRPVTPKTKQ